MASCRAGAAGAAATICSSRPREISFGQVVRIIDGPLAPLPCLSKMAYRRCEDCPGEEACAIRRVFARTHQLTSEVLDGTTLADAIATAPGAVRPGIAAERQEVA